MTVRRVETVGLKRGRERRSRLKKSSQGNVWRGGGEKKNETDFEDFCYSAPAVNIIRSRKPT